MTQSDPRNVISEVPLRQLYDYWCEKRGERRWPARAEILLSEIASLLPFVVLADVTALGQDIRIQLVGTDVAFGVDPTGSLLHEAVPKGAYGDHIVALFRRGASGPGALYSRSSYDYAERPGPRRIARLFMPLSGDGSAVDKMMVGQLRDRQIPADHSAWQANPPAITEEVELRLP